MAVLKKLLSSPVSYAAWLLFVVGVLIASYAYEPYVFGFTAFALAGATVAIAIPAFCVALHGWQDAPTRARVAILVCLAGSATAVGVAFRVLGTFHWA